jgi:hypothetical protein
VVKNAAKNKKSLSFENTAVFTVHNTGIRCHMKYFQAPADTTRHRFFNRI